MNEIDLINLHDEKKLDFYDGTPPNEQVLDYRERLEKNSRKIKVLKDFKIRLIISL